MSPIPEILIIGFYVIPVLLRHMEFTTCFLSLRVQPKIIFLSSITGSLQKQQMTDLCPTGQDKYPPFH